MPETRHIETYRDGLLLSRTPYEVPDAQLRAEAAERRLRDGRAQLRAIRQQAAAARDATGALTLVQLTAQHRQLAGAVATLAQTLMDLEMVMAVQQDDGAD